MILMKLSFSKRMLKALCAFGSALLLLSCSTDTSLSDLRSDEDFGDEEVSVPSNISGSFMDFECESIQGNVACLVRHEGYSLPLGDERLFGQNPPSLVAYLVEDLTAGGMEEYEKSTSINAGSRIDDNNPAWGFQIYFYDEQNPFGSAPAVLSLYNFIQANKDNENLGVVFSLNSSNYAPESGTRKYAVLDKCLLGYYLDEWVNPNPENEGQVTAVPVEIGFDSGIQLEEIAESLYDETCQQDVRTMLNDNTEGRYMDTFSDGMTEIMYDYFATKGIDDTVFDQVVQDNPKAVKLED